MKKLFVLDASAYLYSAYFAIRNMSNAKGESTNALFGFARSVMKLFKDFKPTHFVAVFDGLDNTKKRRELYPAYKAHRQATPGDLIYQIERAQMLCELMGVPWLSLPEVEADDTMGSIAHWAKTEGFLTYLCSGDKDLCQLVNDRVSILQKATTKFSAVGIIFFSHLTSWFKCLWSHSWTISFSTSAFKSTRFMTKPVAGSISPATVTSII
jgi:DNA polymerase-1